MVYVLTLIILVGERLFNINFLWGARCFFNILGEQEVADVMALLVQCMIFDSWLSFVEDRGFLSL